MARVIQVTPEYLETAAGKIEGLAADYKAQYDALYQETGALARIIRHSPTRLQGSRMTSRR